MTPRAALAAILDWLAADATVAAAVGERLALDEAGADWDRPYVTAIVVNGYTPEVVGDTSTIAWGDLGQIDLWESRYEEDESLFAAVVDRLDGSRPTGLDRPVRVLSAGPIPEGGDDGDPDILHTSITVGFTRLR
jgi:hypothetical protein